MSENLTSFESDLLSDLQRHARARRAAVTRRRTAVTATAAVAVVAAVSVGVSVLGAPAGAYAVTEQSDGSVVIVIHELSDERGLERQLHDHGIEADVDYRASLPGVVLLPPDDSAPEPVPVEGGGAVGEPGDGASTSAEVSAAPCDLPDDALPRLERSDDGVRITLPASWAALDRGLTISTSSDAGFDGLTVNAGGACTIGMVATTVPAR